MQYNRRSFLRDTMAATLVGLANTNAMSQAQENSVPYGKDIIEAFEHIPEEFKGINFFGNRAVHHDNAYVFHPYIFSTVVAIHNMLDKNLWKKYILKTNFSDGKIQYKRVPLTENQKVLGASINDEIRQNNNLLAEYDYAKRLDIIVSQILLQSFRAVDYKLTSLGQSDPVKTIIHLLSDKSGDCEDFAVSRYILAREYGVKPEHLAIICYVGRDTETAAHANLALYHEGRKSWFIIDGTGRGEVYERGGTIVLENAHGFFDVSENVGAIQHKLAPYMGVTHRGMFVFNTYDEDGKIRPFEPLSNTGRPISFRVISAEKKRPEPAPN